MTFKTGDKGQRYEVRAKDEAGKQVIIGWADDPEVIDRQEAKGKG